MDIRHQEEIDISAERLWEYLTDPEKVKAWTPSVVSDVPISEGEPGPGYKSQMTISEGGKHVEYGSEITVYEPHHSLALRLSGGSLGASPMDVSYDISPSGNGVSVHYRSQWQPKGLMLTLMSPLITSMSKKNAREQMGALKALVESTAS